MSKLLDRFRYFKQKGDTFADGHGQVMHTNRDWEDSYRQRWQFDKIVRSTHGVNCTGSCSWKIYVKNGLVTWKLNKPTTRARVPIYRTMNRAAARAAPATPGISIAPIV
ncbi:respiratory nitrate reductase 2 subunit alpha [Salmonella enterica subsp. enterica]|uniref:Respiratory nitrate reductase 2 subunit alpha n=1 Tax=Salmonella enterica I TaxID=59201 RepID=A0A379WTL8_SALET|nr:respiratory nitrate reductase 2 subunit alpha [Salmonella enterica subsp. enterica]